MNAPHNPAGALAIALRPMPDAMREALRERFGAQCSTARAVCEQHGRDESPFDAPPPEAVVFCESNQDVMDAVAIAARHRVPVIPFGVGSSLEGHLLAVQGGLSLDLSRMNRILQLNPEDLDVVSRPIDFLGVNYYFPEIVADAAWGPLSLHYASVLGEVEARSTPRLSLVQIACPSPSYGNQAAACGSRKRKRSN